MARTKKVKAPIGYHFMVKSSSDFYLMKTAGSYKAHTSGEYNSSLALEVDVKASHTQDSALPSSTQTSVRTTSSRTTNTTRTVYGRRSNRSSSGGGY